MRKIKNPWKDLEGFRCFGCSDKNEDGLHMEFFENGEEVVCIWEPQSRFQGWLNTLHGGIQCALMDEVAAWVVIKELKTSGVTSKMETKFLKSIPTGDGKITVRGKINRMIRNVAVVDTTIENSKGKICSKAEIYFFTFPREVAIKDLHHRDFEFEEE